MAEATALAASPPAATVAAPIMPSAVERLHERIGAQLGCPRLLVSIPPSRGARPLLLETGGLIDALRTVSLDPPPEVLLVVRPQGHDGAGRVAFMHLHRDPAPGLPRLVRLVTAELGIARRCRTVPAALPGLRQSLTLELASRDAWEPIGHCGTPAAETLQASGLHADVAIDLLEVDVYGVEIAAREARH